MKIVLLSLSITINDQSKVLGIYLKTKGFKWMLAQTGCLIGHVCSPKYKIKTTKKCQAPTFFAKLEKNCVNCDCKKYLFQPDQLATYLSPGHLINQLRYLSYTNFK